jgi:hypothetical protein
MRSTETKVEKEAPSCKLQAASVRLTADALRLLNEDYPIIIVYLIRLAACS